MSIGSDRDDLTRDQFTSDESYYLATGKRYKQTMPTREQIAKALAEAMPDDMILISIPIVAARLHAALFSQPSPSTPSDRIEDVMQRNWDRRYGAEQPRIEDMAPGTTFDYPVRWDVGGPGGLTGRVIVRMLSEVASAHLDELDPSTITHVTPPPALPEDGR